MLATVRRADSPAEQPLEFTGVIADFEADKERDTQWDSRYAKIANTLNDDARDGWTTEGAEKVESHVGVYALADPWLVEEGDQVIVTLRHRSTHGRSSIGRFRVSLTPELGETLSRTDGGSPISELLQVLAKGDSVEEKLRERLLKQFLLADDEYQLASRKLSQASRQLAQLKSEAKPRKVMVLAEREESRDTHVLLRGEWDAKGDVVQPGMLPSVFDWSANQVNSRLDLAHWIVHRDNPLTARVVVNHLWQLMFGQGLVRTPEDFGLQGEFPTHPKLLDWLAVELIDSNWDLQHIIRIIATSETYRQSSRVTPELMDRDPENRLLARAPRFRLPAWMIRDNALKVSGLLNAAVGGPPVLPYQPEGVWAEITMGRFDYQPSLGPSQYRRTVYAFWRRSSAPTFLFDSAQRRVCEVGIRRTNTPLHALTLMNDLTMLEASRVLADSILEKQSNQTVAWNKSAAQQLALQVLSRKLQDAELKDVQRLWSSSIDVFGQDVDKARRYCTVGQREPPAAGLAPTTAAWMTVAGLFLNLDEAITRE